MKYPKIEEARSRDRAKTDKFLAQGKIYHEATSFEEYALKCEVEGVKRKTHLFGLVDPFYILYLKTNHAFWPFAKIVLVSSFFGSMAFGMLAHLVFLAFSLPNPMVLKNIDAATLASFLGGMLVAIVVDSMLDNYRNFADKVVHRVIFND